MDGRTNGWTDQRMDGQTYLLSQMQKTHLRIIIFNRFWNCYKSVSDQLRDQRINWPTDQRTDILSYKNAIAASKKKCCRVVTLVIHNIKRPLIQFKEFRTVMSILTWISKPLPNALVPEIWAISCPSGEILKSHRCAHLKSIARHFWSELKKQNLSEGWPEGSNCRVEKYECQPVGCKGQPKGLKAS